MPSGFTPLSCPDLPLRFDLGSLTAVDAWRRLADCPHAAFLDSALTRQELGRYSFVSADPIDWREQGADADEGFRMVRSMLRAVAKADSLDDAPPFTGGVIACFGYELSRDFERLPSPAFDEFRAPAIAAGLYDVVLAFDHALGTATLFSHGWAARPGEMRLQIAQQRAEQFLSRLKRTPASVSLTGDAPAAIPLAAPCHGTQWSSSLLSNFSRSLYLQAVERAVEYVHAGDVFQVNLSQRLLHPAIAHPVTLYEHLRRENPATFACYFDMGKHILLSASPERFLKLQNGKVETRPIKGTRPLRGMPEADLAAGEDLLASAKDKAENVMIVDLLRNDLSKVCNADGVHVKTLWGLERYAFVQHMVSVVTGSLSEGRDALDLLAGAFPGGSVTGAPKIRAMEIITELEQTARGPYCGSFGYIDANGNMDMNILIRTITAGDGWWRMPVGGGIVAASNPADEYAETWHKAEGMLRAMEKACARR